MRTFTGLGTAIGSLLARLAEPPKVRRDSWLLGSFERDFYAYIPSKRSWRILLAAREFNRRSKRQGHKHGLLGSCGLDVLELLLNVQRRQRGRLEPSIDWIAEKTGWARSTVIRALAALKRWGFLQWRRRYEVCGRPGEPGPTRQQVTSAYAVQMPEALATILPEARGGRHDEGPVEAHGPAPAPQPTTAVGEVVAAVKDTSLRSALDALLATRRSASPSMGH